MAPTREEMAMHDTKAFANQMLRELESKNIKRNLDSFIDSLNTEVSNEYLRQYISVNQGNASVEGKSDDEVRRHISGLMRAQIADLRNLSTLLGEIRNELNTFTSNTATTKNSTAKREAQAWKAISEKSQRITELTQEYLSQPMFSEKDDSVLSCQWFGAMNKAHFKGNIGGNLSREEIENAQHRIVMPKSSSFLGLGISNHEDAALFSHNPSKEDLKQGDIGNCYMHAALINIAENAPDYIRDAMSDDGNGNVTVRFYGQVHGSSRYEPIYITVPKQTFGPQNDTGLLWTNVMEYAYALSGLQLDPEGELKDESVLAGIRAKKPREILDGLDSGNVAKFAKALTGDKCQIHGYDLNTYKSEDAMDIISDCYENGKVAVVSNHCDGKGDDELTDDGFYYNHSYAVIGVEGNRIKLRNPHNTDERYGKEFTITEEQFRRNFNHIQTATLDNLYTAKNLQTVKENYKELVQNLSSALSSQNNFFLDLLGKNSEQYGALRGALSTLSKTLSSPAATVQTIKDQMAAVSESASQYLDYTATNVKDNDRRNNRIAIAQAAKRLSAYMAQDPLGNPMEAYMKDLRNIAAEKMSTAFSKAFDKEVTPDKFRGTPMFNKLMDTPEKIQDAVFAKSPGTLMRNMQAELTKVNQQVQKGEQVPENPVQEIQNQAPQLS